MLLPLEDAPYCVATEVAAVRVRELLRARERRGIGGRLQVALRAIRVADVDDHSDHRRQDDERNDDEHDHLTAFVGEPAQNRFLLAHVETLPGSGGGRMLRVTVCPHVVGQANARRHPRDG